MSVKIMGLVWDLSLPQNEKFVLLAYADHADHDGRNVYPSVGLIARKTGYSERQVKRVTKQLVQSGWLIPEGTGPRGTNRYRIPLPTDGDDILSPPPKPPPHLGVTSGAEGVTSTQDAGDISTPGGDIAVSPEPSLKPSNSKPSENHPPPAQRARDEKPQEEQQVSSDLAKELRAARVFPKLWREVLATGRSDSELLALLRWAQDSKTRDPGALFIDRLRQDIDPPERYLAQPCRHCGLAGEHRDNCTGKYTSGEFAHLIEH